MWPEAERGTAPVPVNQTRDKRRFFFNFRQNLYVVDAKTGVWHKMTLDRVGGYDKEQLIGLAIKRQEEPAERVGATPLARVESSLMNRVGTHILYRSNRRGFRTERPIRTFG